MKTKLRLLLLPVLLSSVRLIAQDINLDSLLDTEIKIKNQNKTQYTEATFKTSRLINGHTVETTNKGVLDFKISHRFGTLDQGPKDLFGVDVAVMRIGADYGLTDRLTIGGGRSTLDKQYDGFLKYRLLRQSNWKTKMPFSVTLLSSAMFTTDKADSLDLENLNTADKLSYAFQILIARKFSNSVSLQLMPNLVHANYDTSAKASMNFFSVGVGARVKLTQRSGIIGEYYYRLPDSRLPNSHDPFSIGYEIETGGHVFQLIVGNSMGLTEQQVITRTSDPWNLGRLHFGFNISRVFTLKRPKGLNENINPSSLDVPAKTDTSINKIPETDNNSVNYTVATFKTSRLINGHTVETTQRGVLDFKVTHRFGTLNSRAYNMFGLDHASMRVGADYGITDRFTIGFGRSTSGENVSYYQNGNFFEKEYDGFLKYKLIWQSTGKKTTPVSVTLLTSAMIDAINQVRLDPSGNKYKVHPEDKLHYAFQILVARKFSDAFSLQAVPTLVHYNIVDSTSFHNNLYSVGFGARLKLTPRSSLNVEYYYQVPGYKLPGTYNSFAIGYEIETGGHVFQLQFTNSYGMVERSFINETRGQWGKGDIHFGFNISRVFTIIKPKQLKM